MDENPYQSPQGPPESPEDALPEGRWWWRAKTYFVCGAILGVFAGMQQGWDTYTANSRGDPEGKRVVWAIADGGQRGALISIGGPILAFLDFGIVVAVSRKARLRIFSGSDADASDSPSESDSD